MKDLFNISKQELAAAQIVQWGYTEQLEPTTYQQFLGWIDQNLHGPLKYLADERKTKRQSLKEVFPECESALVFLFDYRKAKKFQEMQDPLFKVASYTTGFDDQDYHYWIKEKLEKIGKKLKTHFGDLEFKITLDVHPVLERDLAQRSGLGWFGKNSMLINQEFGSYNLIGSLLLTQKILVTKASLEVDHCGSCNRCILACPTNAILDENRSIDASKCISNFTIELFKDEAPPVGYPANSHEIFGCDICQEVCPWNDKSLKKVTDLPESKMVDFFNRELKDIYQNIEVMSNREYKEFFKHTSFERTGKKGFLKNLKYYLER
jgi:epoxyqueuosine reductase